MAKKYLVPIDLANNTLLNALLHPSGTAPTSPGVGQVWYDSTNHTLKIYDNSTWNPVGNVATGAGAPAAAPGAIGALYLDTTNLVVFAAKGTASAADWVPALPYGTTPANLSTAAAAGTSVKVAREDHVHRHTAADHSAIKLSDLAAPTADVSHGGFKITNVATPVAATDAATKGYVDGVATGLDVKASVRAASPGATGGFTYTATGGTSGRGQITAAPNSIDGVTLAQGDRILIKDQSAGAQNGIYVVTTLGTGANGVWDRATDFDQDAEVTSGAFTFVEEGTVNADTGWVLATNNPITIGGASGTVLTFAQFSGAGTIVAGNGLSKTGSTISAVGTASRISVGAGGIDIDATYVGQSTITTLGTVTTGTWSATAIAANKGGTGQTTYAVGDLLYADTASTLGKLADVATGNVLISGGVGVAPAWGKVGLTTHVSGTLGVGNGGTGLATTPTNGQLLIGNGTNYSLATLTQGTGVTITNGAGSISVAIGQAVGTSNAPTFAGLTISGGKSALAAPAAGYASLLLTPGASDPTTLAIGDVWVNGTALKFSTTTLAGGVKTVLWADLSNISGTLGVANGGTGATTLTGYVKGNGTSAMTASATIPGTDISGNISGNAANVTGTVAAANGGTGNTVAPTLNYIAVGDGTKYVPTAPATVRTTIAATTKVTGTNTVGTSFAVNHGLGQWVAAHLFDTTTGAEVICDITNAATAGGTTTFAFTASQTAGSLTYVIVG